MELRTAEHCDYSEILELSQGERWLLTERDVDIMFGVGGTFLVAADNGRLIGMASCIPYSKCGWIGNVVVRKDARRLGLGRKLTQGCIDLIRARGATPVLYAYASSRRMYERMGFVLSGEHLNYCGYVNKAKADDRPGHEIDIADMREVLAFDAEMWGDDRGALLGRMSECATVLACRGARGVDGYIVGTMERGALYIGPWMARSKTAASALYSSLVERHLREKGPLYVDAAVPTKNAEGCALLDGILKPVDRVAEMCLEPGKLPERKGVYGCASLDKG